MTKRPNISNVRHLEVHQLANFLNSRADTNGVVVQTHRPHLLSLQYSSDTKLFIATDNRRISGSQLIIEGLPANTEFLDSESLNENFLADKIMVTVDYVESTRAASWNFLQKKRIRKLSQAAAISIVAVKQGPYWNIAKLKKLLSNQPFAFIGTFKEFAESPQSAKRNHIIAIGGKLTNIRPKIAIQQKILAVIPAFNERDILPATIEHLLDQGVDVHVLDNWSTDGSFEAVELLAKKYGGRVSFERFPAKAVKKWEWFKLLSRVTAVANEKSQYNWIMLNDADEIRWSPWAGISLKQAFAAISSLGFNAVDYTVFTAKPVVDGFNQNHNPREFFKYGEFAQEDAYFVQVKSWQNHPKADLATGGGHHVAFEGQKIYPFKFLLNHYPLRSTEQASEKIFKNRRPRLHKEERKKGWNLHYDHIGEKASFIASRDGLINFSRGNFWQEYLLERISGIGITRSSKYKL